MYLKYMYKYTTIYTAQYSYICTLYDTRVLTLLAIICYNTAMYMNVKKVFHVKVDTSILN